MHLALLPTIMLTPSQLVVTDELRDGLLHDEQALLRARASALSDRARVARELGVRALGSGMSAAEVVALHHAGLERMLVAMGDRGAARVVAAAHELLQQMLAPFEASQRLARESNLALRRLNEALDDQSRQIARALHDNANQLVAQLGIAIAGLEREPGLKRGRLNEMRATLEQIGAELRRASHELRPPGLDDLGVLPAVEHFARGLTSLRGAEVRFLGSTAGRLAPSLETTLYWVIQEALTNVGRHARAAHVTVEIERGASRVTCTVADDGVGFDPGALAGRRDRGLGLISMRERVGAVGGELDLRSSPGAGTTVTVLLPSVGPHADADPARG
jgi:signal transduction histidine kinase